MQSVKMITFLFCFMNILPVYADVNQHFEQIKKNPQALYAFLKKMPKGGELHYHLAGGAYPETMLSLSANGNYCLDTSSYSMEKLNNNKNCTGISSKDLVNTQTTYDKTIKAWSMKNFIPGEESGQEHFFNSFMKFLPLIADYESALLVEILERAASHNEQYMEIMVLPDEAKSTSFGEQIKHISDFSQKRSTLLAHPDFQKTIEATVSNNDATLEKARNIMKCDEKNPSKACDITVKFLYYNLREQPLDNLFAQALNGFEAASRSKNIVGINLVQPEDGLISLRDYQKQMEIFQFLHKSYPKVHIALHAGELAPESVQPESLEFHIHDAIFTGQAERIGHGVAVAFERDAEKTLQYMANHPIPVEINLTSNQKILGIKGKQHPLRYYLSHQVPVVLSTDDEGVLRTDLTRQYQQAVEEHDLDYDTLKQISRNALTYNFMPGQSLWNNAPKAIPVEACNYMQSQLCQKFMKNNPKAALQGILEHKLNDFEQSFK